MPTNNQRGVSLLRMTLLAAFTLSCESSPSSSPPPTLSTYFRQEKQHVSCSTVGSFCRKKFLNLVTSKDLRGGSGGGYGSGNDASYDYGRRGYDDYPQDANRHQQQQQQQQQYSYNDGDGDNEQDRRYYDDGRYEDDDGRGNYEEDHRRKSKSSRSSSPSGSFAGSLPSFQNQKRLGVMFVGAGGMFLMAGIASFFNKFLLRIAHILLCAGAPMIVGPGRVAGYMLQPKKARATITFGLGLFLVLVGHPFFGMILEVFGFLNLFGNLFPIVKVMLRTLPGVGNLFGGNGDSKKRKKRSYDDDGYSDGGRRGRYEDDNPERYY